MYGRLSRLNAWSTQHPFLTVGLWLACAAMALASLTGLRMDPTVDAWLKDGDTRLDGLVEFRAEFDAGRSLVIMLAAPAAELFSVSGMTALRRVHVGMEKIPGTVRVDSVVNFPYSTVNGDDLRVVDLLGHDGPLDSLRVRQVQQRALADERLQRRLINADGSAVLVIATFVPDIDTDVALAEAAYKKGQALIHDVQQDHPQLEFMLSGAVGAMAAYFQAARQDAFVLLPLAFALAMLAMLAYLRFESGYWRTAFASVAAAFVLIVCAVVIPLGLMPALGIDATNAAIVIPVAILTLAVADCLHVLITFYQHRRAPMDRNAALLSSLRLNAEAVWITSLTTALGFLTLNISWALPYIVMGNLVALGVFLAWLGTNTLFPALLSLFPMRVGRAGRADTPMRTLAQWVIGSPRLIGFFGVCCLGVILVGAPQNRMNDAWLEYLRTSTPFGRDTQQIQEEFGGIASFDFVLSSNNPSGIYDPEFLSQVDAFASWLEKQPEVSHVQGIHTTIKRLNQDLHANDPDFYQIPELREEAAQYLLLYELSLPFGASLTNEVNLDKSALRLTAALLNSDSELILDVQQKVLAWFSEHAPELATSGTGDSILFAELGQQLTTSMILNTILVMLAVTIAIYLIFGSLAYGLISLIVNSLPILLALGIWGLLVQDMGMGSALVFSMTIGIIVDFSVHFLSKFRIAQQDKGFATQQGIEYAFSTVGVALLVTTAVLSLNFGLLGLSDHKLNIYMGLLIAMTIIFALLCQLLFLPWLLMALDRLRQRSPTHPLNAKVPASPQGEAAQKT